MALDIAPVRRRQELLDPLGRPFHRALQLARGVGRDDVLGVETGLHAEAAADIANDDAHLLRRDAEHRAAERIACPGGHLAGEAQRQPIARRVVAGERAARLHRRWRQPLIDEVERDDMGGGFEGGIGRGSVAVPHLRHDIASRRRPDERRAGSGRLRHIGYDRQLLELDLDRVERVFSLLARLGDQRGDGLADKTHGLVRKRRTQRRRRWRAIRALEGRRDR